jgi:predicted PurR-regulated permease PerM
MTLTAALLGLWLFSVTRHFLFLILLAWLFAVALEPGIRALIARGAHGESRTQSWAAAPS